MPYERWCPWCEEPILAIANVCEHCGRDVEPLDPFRPTVRGAAAFAGRAAGFIVGVGAALFLFLVATVAMAGPGWDLWGFLLVPLLAACVAVYFAIRGGRHEAKWIAVWKVWVVALLAAMVVSPASAVKVLAQPIQSGTGAALAIIAGVAAIAATAAVGVAYARRGRGFAIRAGRRD